MWRRLEEAGSFLYRHRRSVAGALVLGAAGVSLVLYLSRKEDPQSVEQTLEAEGRREDLRRESRRSSLSQRLRRQVDIQDQLERTLQVFIPTLHLKAMSVVDVSSTIARIKELRASRPEPGSDEEELWEDVKVSAFVLVLVAAYLLSVVTVLLKVQLHIVSSSRLASSMSSGDGSVGKLVEHTYATLFGRGVELLHELAQPIVRKRLEGWRVKEKLSVEYSELVRMLADMRGELETAGGGLGQLLSKMLIRKHPLNLLNLIDFA